MSAKFEKNSTVGTLDVKTRTLVFDATITANATPASKVHATDLPGVAYLRTEGKTADADAIEAASFTTAVDATNAQFGIIIKGSELGTIKRVKEVRVTQVVATGTAIAVAGISGSHLTASGNIVIDILMTGTTLASESPTICVSVVYELTSI